MLSPEKSLELGVLVLAAAVFVIIYRISKWITDCPRTPDPWGNEIEELLGRWETLPLCDNCLAPQEHAGWFCPECGSTVGPFCNYLPYVVVFSQGEVLRSGTRQGLRRKGALILLGYILLPFAITLAMPIPFLPALGYLIVYWIVLGLNWTHGADGTDQEPD